LLEGAPLPEDCAAYQRLIILFDGLDEEALAQARVQWKEVKNQGFEAFYWQQNEEGRWEKKG
jgi:DNA polymerase III subunit chi